MKGTNWWSSMPWAGRPRKHDSWVELDQLNGQKRGSPPRPQSRLAAHIANAGWRRTAYVNTFLEIVVAIVLTSILIKTATTAGALTHSLTFFEGDCNETSRINIWLHLLINVASTCIVASSNYFMQILSSPTRKEVDVAHQKARSLEIGVPSVRNIGHISLQKGLLWSLFVISSVPIHVLFNSVVFEVDYQGSGFFMAMATEAFVQSEEGYRGLGASLINSGAPLYYNFTQISPVDLDPEDAVGEPLPADDDPEDRWIMHDWGDVTEMSDYLDDSSSIMESIASTSRSAKDWTWLDAHECRAQYGTCTPRRNYGSVVIVVDGNFERNDSSSAAARQRRRADPQAGFILEDIYDLTEDGVFWNQYNLSSDDEVREYWGQFGPVDEPNPLWFAAACNISTDLGSTNRICQHTCANALGLFGFFGEPGQVFRDEEAELMSDMGESWDLPLRYYNASFENYHNNWTYSRAYSMSEFGSTFSYATIEERPLFNADLIGQDSYMRITHCWAEPIQPLCKVALSNELLLIVTVGVLVKVALSILTWVLVQEVPLVTPGDAVASFIANPDPTTEGRAALGVPGSKTGNRRRRRREWGKGPVALPWPGRKPARISIGIPWATWLRVYGLMVPGVVTTALLLSMALYGDSIAPNSFGKKKDGGAIIESYLFRTNGNFIGKVVLANTPQLILSLCYFAFNALITRACSEMEWNSYAEKYKALRVSHPEKGQVWTYRLQMPYKYSAPLIVFSVLLHWLVSNTIFVVITEGDYLNSFESPAVMPGISDNIFVSLGYSSMAILICLVLFIVILLIPIASIIRLKKNMAVCGNSSFAISAACHASTLHAQKQPLAKNDSLEMLPLELNTPYSPLATNDQSVAKDTVGSPPLGGLRHASSLGSFMSTNTAYSKVPLVESDTKEDVLRQISRSQVRWGVVEMPPEWSTRFSEPGQERVQHLTFGTPSQAVEEPEVGRLYA